MVKKGYLSIFCAVTLLAACSDSSAPAVDDTSARITLTNDTDESIEAIELQVEQMGHYVSTQGGAYADGSALKKGETLDFLLTEDEVDMTNRVDIDVQVHMDGKKQTVGTLQAAELLKGETMDVHLVIADDGTMNVQVAEE